VDFRLLYGINVAPADLGPTFAKTVWDRTLAIEKARRHMDDGLFDTVPAARERTGPAGD